MTTAVAEKTVQEPRGNQKRVIGVVTSDKAHGVCILDISDRKKPAVVGKYTGNDNFGPVAIKGDVAFVGQGDSLQALSLKDPTKPQSLCQRFPHRVRRSRRCRRRGGPRGKGRRGRNIRRSRRRGRRNRPRVLLCLKIARTA